MSRTITIEPLTRIEGHARISLHLDAAGQLVDARFHVAEYRGFEAFCRGRPFTEMGALTARICGICPVSHVLAAARAGDGLLGLTPPAAARRLRRLLNLAQICQSHALSFFHLSSPDWLLGWESDPARRNLFGLIAADPELARAGIRLRRFGQELIERLAGRRIHAVWAVPGGVRSCLQEPDRLWLLEQLPEARATVRLALERFVPLLDQTLQRELASFGVFDSLFLGHVHRDGRWSSGEGDLRLIDARGTVVEACIDPVDIAGVLAEVSLDWSYLKAPYVRRFGYPEGIYRVGPLARLNVCESIGTPWADRELAAFRARHGRIARASFAYHHARLVELVACLEAIEQLLLAPDRLSGPLRRHGALVRREAVGVGEAPRGTLFHHYRVDGNGLLTSVNLIIATGQNNLAMNRTVAQIAREWIPWPLPEHASIPEPLLNRLEAGIRCFDPCLSCSTHAAGQMPLQVRLFDASGRILAERSRG